MTDYLFAKKPSSLIPFKGNFPLVEEYREREVYDLIHRHRYLDECPEWFQTVVLQAQEIYFIEKGFKEYLDSCGILKEFPKMSSADKSTWLVRFMDKNCLGLERLKIN